MAVTLTTNSVGTRGFVNNAYSTAWDGIEAIHAAVAGKSIYLTRLVVNTLADEIITVGEGDDGTALTGTIAGPLHVAANTAITLNFLPPVKLTAATALTCSAASGGAATIIAEGYVE